MDPDAVVTPLKFIVTTKPQDINRPETRFAVASHASKFPRQKKQVNIRPDQIVRSFLTWRSGSARAWRRYPEHSKSYSENEVAKYRQAVAEIGSVVRDVPTSLQARPSLQQFIEANPLFFYPAQMMLDAGDPHAMAFFPTIDLKEVYHAVMGMFLSWLSVQHPSEFQSSAGLFHQGQAIPILRQRLSQGLHDDETYMMILCTMQTDAVLGNQKALVAHHRGLEALSSVMKGKLNQYCKSIKPKHDFLVMEAGRSPYPSTTEYIKPITPLQYLRLPYPTHVVEMISSFPSGWQELAYQYHAVSLEVLNFWGVQTGWYRQLGPTLAASELKDFDFPSPVFAQLTEMWGILERLDRRIAPLERCLCIILYIRSLGLYYFKIIQGTPLFQNLRAEAADIIYEFRPRTRAERDTLIYYSMNLIDTWKTGVTLEQDGRRLFSSLIHRIPELRRWDTFLAILQRFQLVDLFTAGWKDNWVQSSQG